MWLLKRPGDSIRATACAWKNYILISVLIGHGRLTVTRKLSCAARSHLCDAFSSFTVRQTGCVADCAIGSTSTRKSILLSTPMIEEQGWRTVVTVVMPN